MTDAGPADVHLEFLVEPFVAGTPGPHVEAAIAAVEHHGVDVESGPFANVATGSSGDVAAAVASMLLAAFDRGATRVSTVVDLRVPGAPERPAPRSGRAEPPSDASVNEFLAALRPVVRALGATVERTKRLEAGRGDIPLRWRGEVVGVVRPTPRTEALDHLIAQVEADLGAPLVSLDRSDKQRAVALLHERGAFALRRSTDAVAEAMGVSRITIYNYLNALETPPESG